MGNKYYIIIFIIIIILLIFLIIKYDKIAEIGGGFSSVNMMKDYMSCGVWLVSHDGNSKCVLGVNGSLQVLVNDIVVEKSKGYYTGEFYGVISNGKFILMNVLDGEEIEVWSRVVGEGNCLILENGGILKSVFC